MLNLLQHYGTIIDEILDNDDDRDALELVDYEENYQCTNGVWLCSGATRCAIIDDSCDWIVKFDLDGNHEDYCEREARIYREAKNYDVQDMLVPCIDLGFWHGRWHLYAYKRVEDRFCGIGVFSDEESKIANKYSSSPLGEKSKSVTIGLLRDWGSEMMERLNELCINWRINDLHSGNVGYLDNKLVIIDYAGYLEDDYSSEEEQSGTYIRFEANGRLATFYYNEVY